MVKRLFEKMAECLKINSKKFQEKIALILQANNEEF